MAKFNLRFAIVGTDGARSSVWHLRRHGNQVYMIFEGLGGVQKLSFHTPNICRLAQTREHAEKIGTPRHCMHEWLRHPTPNPDQGLRVRVLLIAVGTNTLSKARPSTRKAYLAIPAAPHDWSTHIELSFTRETKDTVIGRFAASEAKLNHNLIAYEPLENGEVIILSSFWGAVANDTLDMPAPSNPSSSAFGHLVVSPNDPSETGRPIRVTAFSNPKNGDFLQAWEFGAYQVPD